MRKAKPPYQFGQQQTPDYANTGSSATFSDFPDTSNNNYIGATPPTMQPNRNVPGLGGLDWSAFAPQKFAQALSNIMGSGGGQGNPGAPAPSMTPSMPPMPAPAAPNGVPFTGVNPGMGPDMQPAPKVSDNNFLPRTDTISAAPPLLNAPMQTRTVDGAPPPSLQLPGVQKPVSRVNSGAPGLAGLRGLRMFQ